MRDDYEKIAGLDDEAEAGLLDVVLNERDIPHTIRSYHDAAYDGLYQMIKGWGCVIGPAERREEILEILRDIRKGGEAAMGAAPDEDAE